MPTQSVDGNAAEECRSISLAARDEWDAALEGIPHAFAHTWQSCHAMFQTTGAPTSLFVWQQGGARIVCPIAERTFEGHTDVYTPYGFSGFAGDGDWKAMLRDWKEFARERGYVCGYFGMNPILAKPDWFDPAEVFEYNDLYVLDLRRGESALFSALSDNRKRQVRAGQNDLAIVDQDGDACRTFLREHLNDFLAGRGAASTYRFADATIDALLDPSVSVIVGAGSRDAVQAVSLFVYTGHVAEYFAGISLPEGRAYSAALLWRGAMELARQGIPTLNLGGGVTRGDGIAEFKQRFGAQRIPLYSLKQVYDHDVYRRLCHTAGTDSTSLAGFFPSYRARR